ncbi:MAG: hypothetical protein P4M11_14390 [Candidatus Pacebacteria bacterium]|nr:hypothetical protein [Candidatus Paceibacterota bacterium]
MRGYYQKAYKPRGGGGYGGRGYHRGGYKGGRGGYQAPVPTPVPAPAAAGYYAQPKKRTGKERVTVLMVAEKPSIATAIATILGKNVVSRKGCSRVGMVHEYDGDFFGENAHFKYLDVKSTRRVTSVAGHIFSRDFGSEYDDWKAVDPEELFDAETKKIDNPRENVFSPHCENV